VPFFMADAVSSDSSRFVLGPEGSVEAALDLSGLTEDVLAHIGKHLLMSHPPSLSRLRCTSTFFYEQQRRTAALAERLCKICWDPQLTSVHSISRDGRRLRQPAFSSEERTHDLPRAWACGPVLPETGASTWEVVVEASMLDQAHICVGVCDAGCHSGWGLNPNSGRLYRRTRNQHGMIDRAS